MHSGLTMRRLLSLMLAAAFAFWAQVGLATPPMSGAGMDCHHRTAPDHQPSDSAGDASTPLSLAVQTPANAMPCCPSQSEPLPPECGDRPCCVESDVPVRPLALLVVPDKLSKQLSTDGPTAGMSLQAASVRGFLRASSDSPSSIRPVTGKKTDLRI